MQAIFIALCSLVYIYTARVVNFKWGGRDKIKKYQQEIKDYQNELLAASKRNDEKELERIRLRESEMNAKMGDMMMLPFKSMFVILPLFFVFTGITLLGFNFPGIVPGFFPDFATTLPIELHPIGFNLLDLGSYGNFITHIPTTGQYGPRGFFITAGIFIGILLEAVMSRLEARTANQKA